MKLQNKLEHMRGMAVLCNGTRYEIDERGVADIEDEDDAKKLLSSSNWKVYRKPAEEKASKTKKPKTEKQAPPKTPEDEESQEPDEGTEQSGEESAEDGGTGLLDDEGQEAEGDGEEAGEEADADAEGEDGDANEWPDPDVSMKKDYLQAMADAYEVEYEEKTTKAELVELIKAKMYD